MTGRRVEAARGHDLRLAPAAVASWGAAWWASGATAGPVRDAGVAVVVAVGLAAVLLGASTVRGRARRGRPPGPALGLLTTSVLVGACVGVVLCLAAAQLHRWSSPAVQTVAERGGTAVVELVVAGDVSTGRGAAAWQREQVRVRVDLVQVRAPTGAVARVEVPALLSADSTWAGARWGERRQATVRLRPAPAGEPYAVLATVTGPSTVLTPPRWHWRAAERLRGGLVSAAAGSGPGARGGLVSDGAALLPGLVVGDTRLQDDDLVQDLRTAGLSHLSAVSGANVTLVCGSVVLLVVLLRGGRRMAAGLAAVALVALVVVARPEPSVLRAAVMGGVGLLGVVVGRRGGGTSALCVAVVTVLVLDPWLSRAAGFRLSVLATAALVVCTVPWSRALGRVLPRPVALGLAVPAAAQAVVTPVLIGLDPVVSLYALPANVLAAPAVAPATVLGLLAAVLSLADAGLAAVVAAPARWCAAWIAGVGRASADLPGAAQPVPPGLPGAVLAGGGTAVVIALAVLVLRALPDRRPEGRTWAPWSPPRPRPRPRPRPGPGPRPRPRLVGGLGAALVLLLVVAGAVLPPRDPWPGRGWEVVVCDVGQGESVLVRAGPDRAVVVDTGPGPAPVADCLRRAGVTVVPLLVLTHLHADHAGGLLGVSSVARVGRVWTAPGGMPGTAEADVVRWAQEHGVAVDRPVAGVGVAVGTTRVDVLAPRAAGGSEGDAQDVNDAGLVLRVDTGSLVLMAVGDVGADVQREVLTAVGPRGLRADVTTIAHHGSSDQLPTFYEAVGARVAVASAGRDNTYGHPTDWAREVVAASGARVLSTAGDGGVALRVVPAVPAVPAAPDVPAAPVGDGGVGITVGVRTTRRGRRGVARGVALESDAGVWCGGCGAGCGAGGAGGACPPSVPA